MLDILFDARVIAAIIALTGTFYAIRSTNRLGHLKSKVDDLNLAFSKEKQSSDQAYQKLRHDFEVRLKAADSVQTELIDLRDTASVLLAALEAAADSTNFTNEIKHNGIKAAKRMSLFYPPNTSFAEELNTQLSWAVLQLQGQRSESSVRSITALNMNIWKLTSNLMQDLHKNNGLDRDKYLKMEPYRAENVV